jgi:hypothetical protein
MELIVCLLTIFFFAVLGKYDLKDRRLRASRSETGDEDFIVLPFYSKD